MPISTLYATPQMVTDLADCEFYHTIDIPGYGHVKGPWDLRGKEHEYLGKVNFQGKRVLEMGTATGFFCFFMESMGAQVVAYDLSDKFDWDVVPYAQYDYNEFIGERRQLLHKLNNGYWLCHTAFKSHAQVVYGTVYDVPREIGPVDIATFGSILLHVRDPFHALQSALSLTQETVIITEPIWYPSWTRRIAAKIIGPHMVFVPNAKVLEPKETWWILPPNVVQRMVAVLGFGKSEITYHYQKLEGRRILNYTLVAHRASKPKAQVS